MREPSTNQKGDIAEAAIRLAAIKAGVDVYEPASGHSRADLVFQNDYGIWRVQVKWGRLSETKDVIAVHTSGSSLSTQGYRRSTYDKSDVDLFAVYCGELDRCYLLPIELCAKRHGLHLRLIPPRNNQRACTNLAEQYEFFGAIAQLGERRHGMAEVRGSIPLSSTDRLPAARPAIVVKANPFRDHLGYWMDTVAEGQEVVVTRHGKPRFKLTPIDPESAQSKLYEEMPAQASVGLTVRYADLFPEDTPSETSAATSPGSTGGSSV
jgi:prevent-host-death family protein